MKPWAILPVKEMAGAKQRLAPLLSPEERIGLMQVMLRDVLAAFDEKHLTMHDWVWVRFNGEVDSEDEAKEPIKEETLSDGTRIEQWNYRRDRLDEDGALISRYVLTTVGRVVMNSTIIDAVAAA